MDRIYEPAFNEGGEGESMIQSLLEFFSFYRSPVKEADRLEFKGKREANFVLDCQFIETNKSRKIKRDWDELY